MSYQATPDDLKRADLYHETARDALDAWDRGDVIWTIEMGGLGHGYEQCIHITAMEAIRALLAHPEWVDAPNVSDRLNEVLWANKRVKSLGLSGAQAGAAKNLAWHGVKDGWRAILFQVEPDRRIMVSDSFEAKARP